MLGLLSKVFHESMSEMFKMFVYIQLWHKGKNGNIKTNIQSVFASFEHKQIHFFNICYVRDLSRLDSISFHFNSFKEWDSIYNLKPTCDFSIVILGISIVHNFLIMQGWKKGFAESSVLCLKMNNQPWLFLRNRNPVSVTFILVKPSFPKSRWMEPNSFLMLRYSITLLTRLPHPHLVSKAKCPTQGRAGSVNNIVQYSYFPWQCPSPSWPGLCAC